MQIDKQTTVKHYPRLAVAEINNLFNFINYNLPHIHNFISTSKNGSQEKKQKICTIQSE